MKEKQDYLFIGIMVFAFICLIIFVGIYRHNNQQEKPTPSPTETVSPTEEPVVEDETQVHEHCTRTGVMEGGNADLSYEIYYTGKVLNRVESTEMVTSDDEEILDQYEGAYRAIHAHYEGLEYYDTSVIRTDNSVTSKITIDYDHIDIDELISIEGNDNNVFEDEVPKIAKWRALARKVGMKCSKVE